MEKQTMLDKHTYGVNRGEDSPVGHAVQVLTLLLMLAGAYLPANFKELSTPTTPSRTTRTTRSARSS